MQMGPMLTGGVRLPSAVREGALEPRARRLVSIWKFLQNDAVAQLTVWCAAAAVMVAIGFYIIRRFPRREENGKVRTSEMMTTFRDLHSQGELSDEEYRTIKGKLAARLKELSRDDKGPDFTEN